MEKRSLLRIITAVIPMVAEEEVGGIMEVAAGGSVAIEDGYYNPGYSLTMERPGFFHGNAV